LFYSLTRVNSNGNISLKENKMIQKNMFVIIVLLFICIGISAVTITSVATGNWNAAGTWDLNRVPLATDAVVIEGGYTVTLNVSTAALASLTISAGSTFSTTSAYTVNAITITVNGTFVRGSTGSTTGTMSVNNGGTYQHNINGGTIPTATWDAASLCYITGMSNSGPAGLTQTFGNVTWNCPNQTVGFGLNNDTFTVQSGSTFTLTNSGTGSVSVFYSSTLLASVTQTWTGNLKIEGGTFNILRLSNSNNYNATLTVNDLTITGGALNINNYANNDGRYPDGTLAINGNVSISSGTLDMMPRNLDDSSSLLATINLYGNFDWSGGTIKRTCTIVAPVSTINFAKPSGSQEYSQSGGTYTVFGGGITWAHTGAASVNNTYSGMSGLTARGYLGGVNNFTINSSNTIALSANTTVNGIFYMTQGTLNLNAKTLTWGASAQLIYNGIEIQTTGVEWASTFGKAISITNPAGVTLNVSKAAYSGILTNDGKLNCGSYQLTGTVNNNGIITTAIANIMSSGTLNHNAGSTLDYTAAVAIPANANYKNLILSATAGIFSLGGTVTIANGFGMGNNSLNLNGYALQLTEQEIALSSVNNITAMTIIKSETTADLGGGTPSISKSWNIGGSSSGDINITVSWLTAADNGISFTGGVGRLWYYNGAIWQFVNPITVNLTEPRTASFARTFGARAVAGELTISGMPTAPNPVTLLAPLHEAINVSNLPMLSWLPSETGTPAIDFYVCLSADADSIGLVDTVAASPYVFTTPLAYGTTYYWKVIAHSVAEVSTGNTVRSFTTLADPTPLATPVLTIGLDDITGLPKLFWAEVTNANSYYIYWDEEPYGSFTEPNVAHVSGVSYQPDSVDAKKFFKVKASPDVAP